MQEQSVTLGKRNPKSPQKIYLQHFLQSKLSKRVTRSLEVDDVGIIQSHPSTFMQVKPICKVPPKKRVWHIKYYHCLCGPQTQEHYIVLIMKPKKTKYKS